jgi:hypothetical protein
MWEGVRVGYARAWLRACKYVCVCVCVCVWKWGRGGVVGKGIIQTERKWERYK